MTGEWKNGREGGKKGGTEGGKEERMPAGLEVKTEGFFFPGLALNQPAMTSEISPWACLALLAPKNLVPWEICDYFSLFAFLPISNAHMVFVS